MDLNVFQIKENKICTQTVNSFLDEYKNLCTKHRKFIAGEDESATIHFAMDNQELQDHFEEISKEVPTFW